MELSLGFFVILVAIIFPGLIYRRLYFYGEFSKEFQSSYNLVGLLAISTVPGLINLIFVFVCYDRFFVPIDLSEIIDQFKDINNPNVKISKEGSPSINELLFGKASPFIGFLYASSTLSGLMLGRFVRITGIDTKFKILRFKNYWFYLFNGHHTSFKKMKHLKKVNSRHLFTKADVLIDSNKDTYLYSGIVVDYELKDNDNQALSKIMLHNAERYKLKDGKRERVEIPGNILVVDCSALKNINLTYVNEESKSILESKLPNNVEVIFGLLVIILIPTFLFRSDTLSWSVYKQYLELAWYEKIIAYFLTIQGLSLLNPFVKSNKKYAWVNWKAILIKLIWIGVLYFFLWFL